MDCDRSKIRIFFNHSIWRIFLLMLADSFCVAGTTFLSFFFLAPGFCRGVSTIFPFTAAILLCNMLFRCYNGSILYPGAGVNKIEEIRRLAGGVCIAYLLVFAWYSISFENPEKYFFIILFAAFLTGILLRRIKWTKDRNAGNYLSLF